MRGGIAVAAILIAITAQCSAQVRTLTLEEAIRIADEQSLDIRRAKITVDRAQKSIESARAAFLPEVRFDGEVLWNIQRPQLFLPPNTPLNQSDQITSIIVGSNYATTASGSIYLSLIDPVKSAQTKLASASAAGVAAQYQALRTTVRMTVRKAYYRALFAHSENQMRTAQTVSSDVNLQIVRARFREGRATPLDTLTANTTMVRSRAQAQRADFAERTAKLMLTQILDLPNNDSLQLQGSLDLPTPPGPSDGIDATSGMSYARLRTAAESIAQHQRTNASVAVDADKAYLYPSLQAFGRTQLIGQSNSFDPDKARWVVVSQLGINAAYVLSNLWTTSARREESELKLREAELELQSVRRNDSIQLDQLLLRIQAARVLVSSEQASVDQSKKAVEIASILYKEGRTTLFELENTQSKLLDAQIAERRASLEFYDSVAELQALTDELP